VEAFQSQPSWQQRLLALPGRWIVDREIILRTDSSTRMLRVTRKAQVAALCVWAVGAGWLGFASTSYFEVSRVLEGRTVAFDQAHDAYRDLLNQMASHQLAVMAITRDLEAKQGNLRRLLDQNETLKQDLMLTETQLRQSEAERSRVAQTRIAVSEKMGELEQTVRSMWGENGALERHIAGLRGQLASIEAEKEEIAAQRSAMSRRMSQLQLDLKASQVKTTQLELQLDTTRQELQTVSAQRDRMHDDGKATQAKVKDLESRVSDLQRVHREVLTKLNERTRADLAEVQKIVSRTGLNLDTLMPKEAPAAKSAKTGGQGGPFIPLFRDLAPASSDANTNLDAMNVSLGTQLKKLDEVHGVLRSIPLFAPLDSFTLMSGFGVRSDPFNSQASMHYGLDMSAPMRTQVMATAPGTVVVAGWRSKYGRLVEIDHGNGLRTRYGHLHKINVRRGQKVDFRETIGLLGSSGRSTGPHVHYEVLINGEPTDPNKFLRAGKDVFKG